MNTGIFTNIYKDEKLVYTKKLVETLKENGCKLFMYGEVSKRLKTKDAFKTINQRIDAMIVLGGDGTILNIADFCAREGIPILGINLGKVGFLAGLEISDMPKVYEILVAKKYNIEERIMLNATIGDKHSSGLNEIVVSRKNLSKLISIDIFVNDEFVNNYNCDGFIVATPTGSTAYSLSCGGAIISPVCDVIALTAISPHTLNARPMIVSSDSTIRIVPTDSECDVLVDSKNFLPLKPRAEILIKKSVTNAKFIKPLSSSFFDNLLNKLNAWSKLERK